MFTERAPQSPTRHWQETQQNEESSWKGSLCVAQYRNLLSHLHLWRTQKGNLCAWLMNDLLPASLAAQLSLSGTCKWKVHFSMNIQMRQCKFSRLCMECYTEPENRTVRLKTSTPQPPAVCQSLTFWTNNWRTILLPFLYLFVFVIFLTLLGFKFINVHA